DEPISSLDVSIQAQILNLLKQIKNETGVSYIFISHDLPATRYIADNIAVMNNASVVELAEARELFENPRHPYTRLLINSAPDANPDNKNSDEDIMENTGNKYENCSFSERCPVYDEKICSGENDLNKISKGHYAKCKALPREKSLINAEADNAN
ncbi:MAG: ABC transporter ATP-binding protein, partial [Elusimicrobiales bacterium]|nr:ABC transporter ATP-binding protein [Elusimicrobiales bacterium]